MRHIRLFSHPAAAAQATADRMAAVAGAGGHIALAGGSTPRRAYELATRFGLDWSRCTAWFSDERFVDPGDERRNSRMAAEALLDALEPARRPRVELVDTGLEDPDAAAADYERRIRAQVPAGPDGTPVFDLLLLGLGPDAHTASLFPGKPAVEVTDRLVAGVPEAGLEPFVPRVTFTLPLVNAARETLVTATGADKAWAVARAFGADADPFAPAARLKPRPAAHLTLLLDSAAAAKLSETDAVPPPA